MGAGPQFSVRCGARAGSLGLRRDEVFVCPAQELEPLDSDYFCRVGVGVFGVAAACALESGLGPAASLVHPPAYGAGDAGVTCWDGCERSVGPCGLVLGELAELTPVLSEDAAVQPAFLGHVGAWFFRCAFLRSGSNSGSWCFPSRWYGNALRVVPRSYGSTGSVGWSVCALRPGVGGVFSGRILMALRSTGTGI